jgi:hypothetical protein
MGVIKSLEKIYLLKSVGIPAYYLGGNAEMLRCRDVHVLQDACKNQGSVIAIYAKTYIQNAPSSLLPSVFLSTFLLAFLF